MPKNIAPPPSKEPKPPLVSPPRWSSPAAEAANRRTYLDRLNFLTVDASACDDSSPPSSSPIHRRRVTFAVPSRLPPRRGTTLAEGSESELFGGGGNREGSNVFLRGARKQ